MEPCETIVRSATPEDAARLLEIYRYYVEHTAVSFEWETPTVEEFRARIVKTLRERRPYLCAVRDGEIAGYAYAGPFVGRAAYAWSAELTIYLDRDARRQGLGRALYQELEEQLREMGYRDLYACIGLPEAEDEYLDRSSAAFHARMGFREVGRSHHCGHKFGRWYHMICMEKLIGPHDGAAPAIRPCRRG